jgi:hypothetical protein
MKWILLIIIWGKTIGGFYGGEYNTEDACKKAGEALQASANEDWVDARYSCSPKGDVN